MGTSEVNLVPQTSTPILNQDNVNSGGSSNAVVPNETVVSETSGVAQQMGTTTFVDDDQVVVNDTTYMAKIDDTLLSLQDTQQIEQSLISFLQKPVIVASGTFSTSDTYSFLNSYLMPYFPLNSAPGAIWKNKLGGFYGARFTMRFRIVVNANKFQQGRYCIGWVPLTGSTSSLSNLKQITYNNMHMATITQRTTVHHTEIDLNSMTSAELVVPFQSVRPFYPLLNLVTNSAKYELGYLNVYPYSPLVSPAGSTVAGYTVYMSLEDVRLFGAASPQSGLRRKTKDKELSNKLNGPVSGIANAVAKGFHAFESIPLVGSYARDVSWIADKVANVAGFFGFSKPNQGDGSVKFIQSISPGNPHTDGDSASRALSLLSKPGVSPLNGLSGTELDEMDISYLVRKYAWARTLTWTTSNVSGDILTDFALNAWDVGLSTSGLPGNVNYHFGPMGFVTSLFRQWRGSLKFRFKIVKTDFHSGRLIVAHYPGNGAYSPPAAGASEYVNRVIIDVRDTQEFEIVVPYIYTNTWANVQEYIGHLRVSVLDQLVAPATVSSSITILAEVCGGDDFEVSVPTNTWNWTPAFISPQSGLSNSSNIYSSTVGNAVVNADPVANTAISIGECVTSLRALLKRFTSILPYDNNLEATERFNNSALVMRPDAILAWDEAGAPARKVTADLYSTIASCYGIIRGGVRIRDTISLGLLQNQTAHMSPAVAWLGTNSETDKAEDITGVVTLSATGLGFSHGSAPTLIYQDLRSNPVIDVEIPQYSNCFGRSTVDIITYQKNSGYLKYNGGIDSSNTLPVLTVSIPQGSVGTPAAVAGYSLHNVQRSGADDTDFSVFISVPPMQLNDAQLSEYPQLY